MIRAFLRRLFGPAERRCSGCGCTDSHACVDPYSGERCCWVLGYDGDICSFCARVMRPFQAGGPEPPAGRPA